MENWTLRRNVLSRIEREYLTGAKSTPRYYRYVMENRIRNKLKRFYRLELPLILSNPNLTKFHKDLTELRSFERDPNPRPLPYQPSR